MSSKWSNYFLAMEYQNTPTISQARALRILKDLNVFHDLKEFTPAFAGTIPIDVDIEGSDVDILCEVTDFDRFLPRLRECFEGKSNFQITESFYQNVRSIIAHFEHQSMRFEVFGQKKPVTSQNAFQHMMIEARLLKLAGPESHNEIRRIKRQGHKTEPAFAKLFGIPGDGFAELLGLAKLSDEDLLKQITLPKFDY